MSDVIRNVRSSQITNANAPYADTALLLRTYPMIFKALIDQFGERRIYMPVVMQILGNIVVTDNNVGYWGERGTIQNVLIPASPITGTPGPGNPVTFQIDASQYQNNGTQSPGYLNLIVNVGGQNCVVSAKNTTTPYAHTITLTPPTGSTTDIVSQIVAGTPLMGFTELHGQGTGHTLGSFAMPKVYQAYTGIIKDKIAIDGSFAGTKMPFAIDEDTKKDVYFDEAQFQATLAQLIKVNHDTLLGRGETYTDPTDTTKTIQNMYGLEWYADVKGTLLPSGSTPTMQYLYDLALTAKANRVGSEFMGQVGSILNGKLDILLGDKYRYTLQPQNWGIGSATEQITDLGFEGFKVNDIKFYKKVEDAFDDPNALGLSTYQIGRAHV